MANDELESPYTWEVELSRLGQLAFDSEEDKRLAFKDKWEELIDSGRLGYSAILRNLRNFFLYEISEEHWRKVIETIPSLIPFRI